MESTHFNKAQASSELQPSLKIAEEYVAQLSAATKETYSREVQTSLIRQATILPFFDRSCLGLIVGSNPPQHFFRNPYEALDGKCDSTALLVKLLNQMGSWEATRFGITMEPFVDKIKSDKSISFIDLQPCKTLKDERLSYLIDAHRKYLKGIQPFIVMSLGALPSKCTLNGFTTTPPASNGTGPRLMDLVGRPVLCTSNGFSFINISSYHPGKMRRLGYDDASQYADVLLLGISMFWLSMSEVLRVVQDARMNKTLTRDEICKTAYERIQQKITEPLFQAEASAKINDFWEFFERGTFSPTNLDVRVEATKDNFALTSQALVPNALPAEYFKSPGESSRYITLSKMKQAQMKQEVEQMLQPLKKNSVVWLFKQFFEQNYNTDEHSFLVLSANPSLLQISVWSKLRSFCTKSLLINHPCMDWIRNNFLNWPEDEFDARRQATCLAGLEAILSGLYAEVERMEMKYSRSVYEAVDWSNGGRYHAALKVFTEKSQPVKKQKTLTGYKVAEKHSRGITNYTKGSK